MLSRMWRVLARRAQEVARLVSRHTIQALQHTLLQQHLLAALSATRPLCDTLKQEVGNSVAHWARSLLKATAALNAHWIDSLTALADIKAKKLEVMTAGRRRAHWREAIGAKPASDGANRWPTKLAYRWARGITGWQTSPLGQQALNDQIDDEHSEPVCPEDSILNSTEAKALIPLADQAVVESQANG